MFREAENLDSQGDEERAFIMYMRYFNIIKQVKTSPDYKKNKVFCRGEEEGNLRKKIVTIMYILSCALQRPERSHDTCILT